MILAATAGDAGAYYVQAVNERNGENRTSPPVHLSVARECSPGAFRNGLSEQPLSGGAPSAGSPARAGGGGDRH